ncbi:MAG: response regulator transcription factor [Candidatus Saganbacteria bacterium]|nr:response regulator transcription factor [Candidatus Saganbacteria bacterium]
MTKILVVDDAPEISILMEDILRPFGYEVEAAANANAAWEKVRLSAPTLILLDIMMPGKSGYEFCAELKASTYKDIPVIMVSVKREQKDVDMGLKVGASDYITKPFDPDDLVERIKKVLAKKSG